MVIATSTELAAVRARLTNAPSLGYVGKRASLLLCRVVTVAVLVMPSSTDVYYVGQLGDHVAAVVKCEMGSGYAGGAEAVTNAGIVRRSMFSRCTDRALAVQHLWKPELVAMPGILGGLRDPLLGGNQRVGDIVVASQVRTFATRVTEVRSSDAPLAAASAVASGAAAGAADQHYDAKRSDKQHEHDGKVGKDGKESIESKHSHDSAVAKDEVAFTSGKFTFTARNLMPYDVMPKVVARFSDEHMGGWKREVSCCLRF